MERKTPKYYHGVVIFTIAFVFLLFISPVMNQYLGIYGTIIAQLFLGGLAVVSAVIVKADLKQTFPMRLPPVRHFFGAVFLYVGVYMLSLAITFVMIMIFPDMTGTVDGLINFGVSMPNPAVAVIVIALLPAVCEELLVRGFILSSFSGMKEIFAVITAGILFGILHFDIYRFVPTAILGMASAYITLKTGSLILPILYHFVNNTMSVISMYQLNNLLTLSDGGVFDVSYTVASIIGVVLLYISISVITLYIGSGFLNKRRENQITTLIVVLITILLFVGGIVLVMLDINPQNYIEYLSF